MEDLITSHKLFHSFCIKPKTHFDTQDENETVILVLRAHPITLFPLFINGFFFFFILFFTNFFLPTIFKFNQILFMNIIFMFFIGNYVWLGFLNWYFNVGIITDKRIVDVNFNVILYKSVTYTLLDHIEDVSAKSGGFLESVLNFGNIYIQTAGSELNTHFENVPNPSGAVKIINALIQKAEKPVNNKWIV